MILFVDSAAHLALLDVDDQHSKPALNFLRGLENSKFVTSTLVLSEVATRGNQLVGAWRTATYVRTILANPAYTVIEIGIPIFQQALSALIKYEDQDLSLTDCTTTLIMRDGRIRTIFTFDDAFRKLGFQKVP